MNRFAKWFASLLVGRRGLHPTYGSLLRDSSHIIALSERHAEAFAIAHPGVSSKTKVIPAPPAMRFAGEEKSGSDSTARSNVAWSLGTRYSLGIFWIR